MTIKLEERNTENKEYTEIKEYTEQYTGKRIPDIEPFSPSMEYIPPPNLPIIMFIRPAITSSLLGEVSSTSSESFIISIEEVITKEEKLRRLVSRYLEYAISKEEFEYRFGDVDLEYFHEHMDPDVFGAFIKGLGVIPGSSELRSRREEEIV